MVEPLKPVAVLVYAQTGTSLPNLELEVQCIDNSLNASGYQVRCVPNARLADIVTALNDPDIRDRIVLFHYAGHSHGAGVQLQCDENDAAGETAYMAGFAGLVALVPNVVLMFLNSCVSRDQLLALTQVGIPLVIATNEGIDDEHARLVAERFYGALEQKRNIDEAFEIAGAAGQAKAGSPRGAYWGNHQKARQADLTWPWELHGSMHCRQWKLVNLLEAKRRQSESRHSVVLALGVMCVVLLGIVLLGLNWLQQNLAEIKRDQKVTSGRIRAHFDRRVRSGS